MAVSSGGKCGSGALAGGVSALAGPFLQGQSFTARVVMGAALSGLASVAGGGKFANGAVTGAFGYLFNEAAGAAAGTAIGGGFEGLGALANRLFGVLGMVLSLSGDTMRDQLVVRGGLCTADRFCTGSGVTIDENGNLQGVSVQSFPDTSVQ